MLSSTTTLCSSRIRYETLMWCWTLSAVKHGGVLVTLVSPIPTGEAEQNGVRGIFFIVSGNRGQLDQISALVDGGKLKPVIAEVLPLARAREAFEHGAAKHAPGKIVLQVAA